ncbi:MAG: hypothetical protein KTR24_10750 [Saprospiraceae bacterium]|nr:hypothetical protein [Saprospiraceae bacterium]
MQLMQVMGQDDTKKMMVNAIAEDRLAHAFLLLGHPGFGGLPLALGITQYLMCENRQGGDSCGTCPACIKVSQCIHPDLHFTFPSFKAKSSKSATSLDWMKEWRSFVANSPYGTDQEWLLQLGGENKQGNISRDECVRIVKTLGLKAFESEYRVQIIWMAEYLAKEGNRLLKIIEEPPEKTLFFLIAADEDKVLNTILSRCQIIRMKPVPAEVLTKQLMAQHQASQQDAERIVGIARGNPGTAISLLAAADVFGAASWLDWMRIVYKRNPAEMVQFADQFAQYSRESQKAFLNYGLHFMRALIANQNATGSRVELPAKEQKAAEKIGEMLSPDAAFQAISLVEESIYHLERYANPRLVMLDNSIRISLLMATQRRSMTPKKASA